MSAAAVRPALLAGDTATTNQPSAFPHVEQPTSATLTAPVGTTFIDDLIDLASFCRVRVVRIGNSVTDAAVIHSGGIGDLIRSDAVRVAALAASGRFVSVRRR